MAKLEIEIGPTDTAFIASVESAHEAMKMITGKELQKSMPLCLAARMLRIYIKSCDKSEEHIYAALKYLVGSSSFNGFMDDERKRYED